LGTLTDADIRNLGAYFNRPPYNTTAADEKPNAELAARGQAIVTDYHCVNCHRNNFRGERAASAIADLREDYLVTAWSDYRSAVRPSTGVAAMTEAAAGLNAIAHCFATFGPAGR
jgi:cytochrome c553